MPENEKVYVSGIILIDRYGNRYCELNRYQEAVICIVYDASSIIIDDVEHFSNSKNPDTLPSNNGIFVAVEDSAGEWLWKDIDYELKLLKMNRIIDIVDWGLLN